MTKYSLLDLCPITEGSNAQEALKNSLDLAQHAESWGYHRYWLAEHHNMPSVASAATAIAIGHIAAGTKSMRVGAGGIMLPNHSPLVIAEQFGTLDALFPGRIDLGLGRAPGTDQATSAALRRTSTTSPDQFPADVEEILHYFATPTDQPRQKVQAIPGQGSNVPLWILGSSLFGAQLAAMFGLPYAFASHFAPADLMAASQLYRSKFRPSEHLDKPYLMLAVNVLAAESDEQAEFLASSTRQAFLRVLGGRPSKLPPPKDHSLVEISAREKALLDNLLACAAIGSPATVTDKLHAFIDKHQPDEVMLTGNMFDHQARLRSFEIAAEVMQQLQ